MIPKWVCVIDILYSYALHNFVTSFKRFSPNPKSIFIAQKSLFLRHPVLRIYVENHVRTGNLRIKSVNSKYVQEQIYCDILVFLSMLFVHPFIHTIECYCINQIDM